MPINLDDLFTWYQGWPVEYDDHDFDYFIELVDEIVTQRRAIIEADYARLQVEEPELADDMIDDPAYYSGLGSMYLWEFAFWRMQGLLEGMIEKEFLPQKNAGYRGLKDRLNGLNALGISISPSLQTQLDQCAMIRNELSHRPPRSYSPAGMTRDHVISFRDLALQILTDLRSQKP